MGSGLGYESFTGVVAQVTQGRSLGWQGKCRVRLIWPLGSAFPLEVWALCHSAIAFLYILMSQEILGNG